MYVACMRDQRSAAFAVTLALRQAGIRTEADYQGRSLKAQFKQANKLGARLCVVLGADEVAANNASVRDMENHEQTLVPMDELVAFIEARLG